VYVKLFSQSDTLALI